MRIFRLPHASENASILEHDLAFITSHFWSLFSVLLKMVTWFALLLTHWFWIDNECNFRIKSIKFNEVFWEGLFFRPFSMPLCLKNSFVKSSQFWTWLWIESKIKLVNFRIVDWQLFLNCWVSLCARLIIFRQIKKLFRFRILSFQKFSVFLLFE